MSSFGFSTTAEEVVEAFPAQVKGRTFAITGTSAEGLGGHAAISLARAGPAHLLLLSRNKSKVEPVIQQIRSINSSVKVTFVEVSLDNLDSVRRAAQQIDALTDHIDVLINNAGVMAIPNYTINEDGIETTLATNHVGHFLLTKLLLPKLIDAANRLTDVGTTAENSPGQTEPANKPQARIINLTSRGHQISPFRTNDPNFQDQSSNPYDPWTSYGQSKTANILFTLLLTLSRTLRENSIRSFAVHPGGIYTTGLTTHLTQSDFNLIEGVTKRNTGQSFRAGPPKNLTQGTSSILWAALDPSLNDVIADPHFDNEYESEEKDKDTHQGLRPRQQGLYVSDCDFITCRRHARDMNVAREMWTWTEGVIGERFEI